MNAKKPMSKEVKIALGALVIPGALALLWVWTLLGSINTPIETVQGGQVIHVENIFVDMNGDGRLDLVVSGEVIYNATR